jgi:hypothetical protein
MVLMMRLYPLWDSVMPGGPSAHVRPWAHAGRSVPFIARMGRRASSAADD